MWDGSTYRTDQCFSEGLDTVKFVLYYAPYNTDDSLAQVSIRIGNATGLSPRFPLAPGPLARMVLEKPTGGAWDDTLTMHVYDFFGAVFVAMGYDQYGNRRGRELSSWAADSTIPPPPFVLGRQCPYDISSALENDSGYVYARVVDITHGLLADSIRIRITGIVPVVVNAIMRDTNGNGLLDRVELLLSKRPQLPNTSFVPSRDVDIWVSTMLNRFMRVADTITVLPDTSRGDTTMLYLHLVEDTIRADQQFVQSSYQTSWPLKMTSKFGGLIYEVDSLSVADGAGPVVVSARKRMVTAWDRTKDIVTLTFSEPVFARLATVSATTIPDSMFRIWERDTLGTGFVRIDSFLVSIPGLLRIGSRADSLAFLMTNANNLLPRHFVSFDGRTSFITDQAPAPNRTHPSNRRVPIVLEQTPPNQAQIWPNPASFNPPSNVPPGKFYLVHDEESRQRVQNGICGGTLISFPVITPSAENPIVKANMRIYDMAGNLVQAASNSNLLQGTTRAADSVDQNISYIDVYWNCTNMVGTPVSPGIYKYVIYLDFPDYDQFYTMDTKLFGNIGVISAGPDGRRQN